MFRPVRAGCASRRRFTLSPDECAAGYLPCRQDLVCLSTGVDPTAGTCQPPPSLFCNPRVAPGSSGNACPAESACITVGTHAETQDGSVCAERPNVNLSPQPTGLCRRAQIEGERCDSEWTSAIQPLSVGRGNCLPCAPGLLCWNTTCRRPCRAEDGGSGNCAPDAQTAEYASHWVCESETGRRFDPPRNPEHPDTQPLCAVYVDHGQPCRVPSDLRQQSLTPANVCHDPDDFCVRPVNVSHMSEDVPPVCCRPPGGREVLGGACTSDDDCCRITAEVFGKTIEVQHCCDASLGRGCRPGSEGHCAGCGPGTGVPCCLPDGIGCASGSRCVGTDDRAVCVPCGGNGSSCCIGDNACTSPGLDCFDRPRQTLTGDRCEACGAAPQTGSAPQQCCPGNVCRDDSRCIDGVCQFCGERNERCCPGRRCATGEFLECQGSGPGICVQTCGAPGLDCCEFGSVFGPRRRYCLDRAICEAESICFACGAQGQACCESGNSCDAGLGCDSFRRCVNCGGLNQPCCSVFTPPSQVSITCAMGFACGNRGTCIPCGGEDQPCCPSGPACVADGTSCSSGTCIRPPG